MDRSAAHTSFRDPSVPEGGAAAAPESLELLDRSQVASLRHIGNLARQLKGDWSNMLGPTDLNEGFGGFRFQIAYAAFTLALTHFHRLPAAPGLFKPTLERQIQKMLEPDVWWYWHDVSKGGGLHGTPRSEGSIDPVAKDNIMYSAYLQTMTLLYNMLFDDDRYTKPGALTLAYDPLAWGDAGGYSYEYDQNSLNERVYWNMVESGYLGVACEPYCVFQICNQIPIIGFRLHDALNGGNTAEEVTAGYLKAWNDVGGLLDADGDYNMWVYTHIDQVVPSTGGGSDAWAALLMHSWNAQFVEANYERQRDKWLNRYDDGTISVKMKFGDAMPEHLLQLFGAGEFAFVAAWASEMGDEETLKGMLAYADKMFSPRIQNGGLTYARNDTVFDKNGNFILSAPFQANALLPLARLNVPSGLRQLYSAPWGPQRREHYSQPALTEVDFSIDVYRAVYLPDDQSLLFDLATMEGGSSGSVLLSRIFGRGDWTLSRDGSQIAWGDSNGLLGSSPEADVGQRGQELRLGISSNTITPFILTWST